MVVSLQRLSFDLFTLNINAAVCVEQEFKIVTVMVDIRALCRELGASYRVGQRASPWTEIDGRLRDDNEEMANTDG
eukprot:1901618-Amphidinium_carterae.1